MKKFKYLKDYPLNCLVKHYDKTGLVAKCDVPKEWLDLEIVHTYVYNSTRVLVVK
ncbi:MAG: hypothetical protein UHD64_00635 [Bacteroidales bacterium]|nr:hypothetical protein [Bacteroidales bacterium]